MRVGTKTIEEINKRFDSEEVSKYDSKRVLMELNVYMRTMPLKQNKFTGKVN